MSVVVNVFRSRRVLIMFLLGFSSGLPYLLTSGTLSAWMANVGVKVSTIGFFSLATLPYSLKFLWAPLLDRYRLPLLGRRRGWMVLFQLALMAGLAALGSVDPRPDASGAPPARQVLAVAALALVVSFLSANQDIVCDAYRTDLLEREERAAGTATFVFGYRVSMLTAGALAMILSDHIPWRAVYRLMAGLMIVGVVTTWYAPEPANDRPPRRLRDAIVDPFLDFFRRPAAVWLLLLIMCVGLGDHIARNLVMPFLVKTGFTNSEIGEVTKVFGLTATLLGTLGGGALVARFGLWRSLVVFAALQPLGAGCYALLALHGKSHGLLFVAVAVDNVTTGLVIAALEAFLMSLCNKRYSATQYALLTSATGIAGRLVGANGGLVVARVGWAPFFGGTMAIAVPALALLFLLRRVVESVDAGTHSPSTS